MSTRKTAIVVCPGRGTYNAPELGYLSRYHADKGAFISMVDDMRRQQGKITVSELDSAEKFSPSQHGRGDNASPLIYACALADFMSINRELYDIVGVTGNSMGWYLALTVGGALSLEGGAHLVNTMGQLMTQHGKGGQVVYSHVDEEWKADHAKKDHIQNLLQTYENIHISINLGGMTILAIDDAGIKTALAELPADERFPFQLRGHAAFHSRHLDHCVELAQERLKPDMFAMPDMPLIDGLGNIWQPFSTDTQTLYNYTLGRQINETYDFTKAIDVAAKEFAPDVFIVLGPGTTLGAPVAQTLIAQNWQDLENKTAFKTRQSTNPLIMSMGMEDQRKQVVT